MKKAATKGSASPRAGVKKSAIKDLSTGAKAAGVKGGKKAFSQPSYGCSL